MVGLAIVRGSRDPSIVRSCLRDARSLSLSRREASDRYDATVPALAVSAMLVRADLSRAFTRRRRGPKCPASTRSREAQVRNSWYVGCQVEPEMSKWLQNGILSLPLLLCQYDVIFLLPADALAVCVVVHLNIHYISRSVVPLNRTLIRDSRKVSPAGLSYLSVIYAAERIGRGVCGGGVVTRFISEWSIGIRVSHFNIFSPSRVNTALIYRWWFVAAPVVRSSFVPDSDCDNRIFSFFYATLRGYLSLILTRAFIRVISWCANRSSVSATGCWSLVVVHQNRKEPCAVSNI